MVLICKIGIFFGVYFLLQLLITYLPETEKRQLLIPSRVAFHGSLMVFLLFLSRAGNHCMI